MENQEPIHMGIEESRMGGFHMKLPKFKALSGYCHLRYIYLIICYSEHS